MGELSLVNTDENLPRHAAQEKLAYPVYTFRYRNYQNLDERRETRVSPRGAQQEDLNEQLRWRAHDHRQRDNIDHRVTTASWPVAKSVREISSDIFSKLVGIDLFDVDLAEIIGQALEFMQESFLRSVIEKG